MKQTVHFRRNLVSMYVKQSYHIGLTLKLISKYFIYSRTSCAIDNAGRGLIDLFTAGEFRKQKPRFWTPRVRFRRRYSVRT